MSTVYSQRTISIKSRCGTLQWETGEVEYEEGSDWITSISPESGTANSTNPAKVIVEVSREGLLPGTYTAVVPVDSRRGSVDIVISMDVAPPECETDFDCDDSRFCNGDEICLDGECAVGEASCSSEQICSEVQEECVDVVLISASVSNRQKTLRRPVFLKQRCLWLALKCEKDSNFETTESTVNVEGASYNFQGLEVNQAKRIMKVGMFIFVPICIEQGATVGQWTLEIETTGIADNPFEETIEAGFQIE
jgi:hypothetical protein